MRLPTNLGGDLQYYRYGFDYKRPPMIASTISCRTMTATVPSAAPIESAPISPMKIWAGYVLNHKSPIRPQQDGAENEHLPSLR